MLHAAVLVLLTAVAVVLGKLVNQLVQLDVEPHVKPDAIKHVKDQLQYWIKVRY